MFCCADGLALVFASRRMFGMLWPHRHSWPALRATASTPVFAVLLFMWLDCVLCVPLSVRRLLLGEEAAVGRDWVSSVLTALGFIALWTFAPLTGSQLAAWFADLKPRPLFLLLVAQRRRGFASLSRFPCHLAHRLRFVHLLPEAASSLYSGTLS